MMKKLVFAAALALSLIGTVEISPSQSGSYRVSIVAGPAAGACGYDPECRRGTLNFP